MQWVGRFSNVGFVQYSGGITSVQWRITSVHVGDSLSTVKGSSSSVGHNVSTCGG